MLLLRSQSAGVRGKTGHRNTIQKIEGGFPHSEIPGSKLVRSSPRLIAAYHVLHRLSAPRHPPNALKTLDRFRDRCPLTGSRYQRLRSSLAASACSGCRPDDTVTKRPATYLFPDTPPYACRTRPPGLTAFAAPTATFPLHDVLRTLHAADRRGSETLTTIRTAANRYPDRTPRHHRIKTRRPCSRTAPSPKRMVEPDGIEPTTSCLQSTRSPN